MAARVRKGDWPGISSLVNLALLQFGAGPTVPIDTSATPSKAQAGFAFIAPNLLLSTLAALAILPVGRQLDTSAPIQKYQVQCEQQPRDLVLGIPKQVPRNTFITEYQAKSAVEVDQAPYSLTLGIPVATPRNPYLTEYPGKVSVQADQYLNYSTLGINPEPLVRQVYESAPPPKFAVQVDEPLVHPLTLGINPQPLVCQISDSAPILKFAIEVDPLTNRLALTTLAAPFLPVDTSQIESKEQVQVDHYLNYSTLGINPEPLVRQVYDSAPPPKFAVQVDEPLVHPLTLGINPQPLVQQLDRSTPPPKFVVQVDQPLQMPLGLRVPPKFRQLFDSAPPPKFTVQCEQQPRNLAIGINPQPLIKQLDGSAPPLKVAVEIDPLTNRLVLTAAAVVVPFKPIDTDQLQPKAQIQADQYLNYSTLGIPTQVPRNIFAIEYQAKSAVEVDVSPNLLALRTITAAPFKPIDTTQLQPKIQLKVDQPLVLPLTLGIPVATPRNPYLTEYPGKISLPVDQYLNYLTLGIPPPPVVTIPFNQFSWPNAPVGSVNRPIQFSRINLCLIGGIWSRINDSQTPLWGLVADSYTADTTAITADSTIVTADAATTAWASIPDSQVPSWAGIIDSYTSDTMEMTADTMTYTSDISPGSWTSIPDSQNPGWSVITIKTFGATTGST